jgi:hypothetical protein
VSRTMNLIFFLDELGKNERGGAGGERMEEDEDRFCPYGPSGIIGLLLSLLGWSRPVSP